MRGRYEQAVSLPFAPRPRGVSEVEVCGGVVSWERGTAGGRGVRTVSNVFVSYVVRMNPSELERGRFVGEIEGVATGERRAVGSLQEMASSMLVTVVGEQRARSEGAAALGSDPSLP